MRSAESKHLVVVCLVAAGAALFVAGCSKREAPPEVAVVTDDEPADEASADIYIEVLEYGFMDVLSDGSSPAPPEAAGEASTGVASMMAEAAATEDEGGELDEEGQGDAPPRRGTVTLQYLVEYFGEGPAPEGVDVEFVQKGADGDEKGRYPDWVSTYGLEPGAQQVDVTDFEVDDYDDGDEFTVEWDGAAPPQ